MSEAKSLDKLVDSGVRFLKKIKDRGDKKHVLIFALPEDKKLGLEKWLSQYPEYVHGNIDRALKEWQELSKNFNLSFQMSPDVLYKIANILSPPPDKYSKEQIQEFLDIISKNDAVLKEYNRFIPNLGLFVSALINKKVGENDGIKLKIPENLRLDYFGSYLKAYHLIVSRGSLGDHFGYRMQSNALIEHYGNVGNYAGNEAGGYFYTDTLDAALLWIYGNIKDFGGAFLGNTVLHVIGNTGKSLGYSANGGKIIVKGKIESIADSCNTSIATI